MLDHVPFRERAREVSRIEAFSDVVFGFALTLIVISLEVPNTYAELMHDMRGFLGFAICFAILMWIWHAHHTFFRRYGLTDNHTLVVNTLLLFLVLYYVYPLKFIFSLVTGSIDDPGRGDASTLFIIYGLGFAGIFALFLLLYLHAYHKRHELELNEYELHDTFTMMWMYGAYVGIGLLSTAFAVFAPGRWVALAGFTYFLLGPVSAIIGVKRGYARRALHNRQVQSAQATPNTSDTAAVPTVAGSGP
ncbi:MAG TPA: TMEM175 family protein [Vicinamibacterales bacterium]|nr:TMEM175 family protein [Vicinamibacterales bacterium]